MKNGGKTKKKAEAEFWRINFPTQHARAAADESIDKLSPLSPMQVYVDYWIAAYKKAGGICSV